MFFSLLSSLSVLSRGVDDSCARVWKAKKERRRGEEGKKRKRCGTSSSLMSLTNTKIKT